MLASSALFRLRRAAGVASGACVSTNAVRRRPRRQQAGFDQPSCGGARRAVYNCLSCAGLHCSSPRARLGTFATLDFPVSGRRSRSPRACWPLTSGGSYHDRRNTGSIVRVLDRRKRGFPLPRFACTDSMCGLCIRYESHLGPAATANDANSEIHRLLEWFGSD